MARPLRIEYAGAVYHITTRGNARKKIFKDAADRTTFIEVLCGVNVGSDTIFTFDKAFRGEL